MGLRKQMNVGVSSAAAEKMQRFARMFHGGELAPVARNLIEDGLTRIQNESDYLELLKRSLEMRSHQETAPFSDTREAPVMHRENSEQNASAEKQSRIAREIHEQGKPKPPSTHKRKVG